MFGNGGKNKGIISISETNFNTRYSVSMQLLILKKQLSVFVKNCNCQKPLFTVEEFGFHINGFERCIVTLSIPLTVLCVCLV